jgi:glycosyltransferase involved in cell wall biosynthesis
MIKKNKIILVTSTQFPGHGGAATNSYALIGHLKDYYTVVGGIFFINTVPNEINSDCDYNNFGNIFKIMRFELENKYHKNQMIIFHRKKIMDKLGGIPDIILSKNYIAPSLSRLLFPESKIIYLVSGIYQFMTATYYNNEIVTAQQFLNNNEIQFKKYDIEIKAMQNSNYIITNSNLTRNIFNKIYPEFSNIMYPKHVNTTNCISSIISKGSDEKINDIIIIVSNVERDVKNVKFLIDVMKSEELTKYNKIIVGDNSNIFLECENTTVFGKIKHHEVISLLKKTKILLMSSIFDSNSNTAKEAYESKCIILTTLNIGYAENYPKHSICDSFDKNEWKNKIIFNVDNYNELIEKYNIDFSSEPLELVIDNILDIK